MKTVGDEAAIKEVIAQLAHWDNAICKLDIHGIIQLCAADVSLFDMSAQSQGVVAYQHLWQRYQSSFSSDLKVFRKHVSICAESHIAFVYGYSKIDHAYSADNPNTPWCRSTLCLRKQRGQWQIIHQHISLPVDMDTEKMKKMSV